MQAVNFRDIMLRRKEILLVIALSITLQGFWGNSSVKKGQPPAILEFYAPRAIKPGDTWRVYLHARDKDADMKDISAMLLEAGNVMSPTSFTRIKRQEDRAEFKGYLYLKTPNGTLFFGRRFLIRIQVRDQELNRSQAVTLTLSFDNAAKADIPEKWQTAANHRLGSISIELAEFDDWRRIF